MLSLLEKKLETTPAPHSSQEDYTYVPIKKLGFLKDTVHSSQTPTFTTNSKLSNNTITIENGTTISFSSDINTQQIKFEVLKLKALETHPLKKQFLKSLQQETDYGALQAIKNTDVLCFYINGSFSQQISFRYINTIQKTHCHLLFVAEPNSKASLLIDFEHSKKQQTNQLTQFFLNHNSHLECVFLQKQLQNDSFTHKINLFLNKQAHFKGHSIAEQTNMIRENVFGQLNEKESNLEWYVITNLVKDNQVHRNIIIHHLASHTTSRQVFKNVLQDNSISSVSGNIIIGKDIAQVDANQLMNNLILSDTSKANCRPNIQIFSDDVKCSHGVTMGQMNKDQIFYLQSRGISITQAKQILVKAFLKECLQNINHTNILNTVLNDLSFLFNLKGHLC